MFSEDKEKSKSYKKTYLDGIEDIIVSRQKEAGKIRRDYVENLFKNPEKYRNDFKEMLGWPLVGYSVSNLPKVKSEKLAEEEGYEIFRMEFEILDNLWMSGLFFKQKLSGKKPLVLVLHGGLGTPEFISGLYGSTGNYNDILSRVIQYDVHAFAPQLLLWSEDYDVPFDRNMIDGRLKRVGSSITAIEIFGFTRILDYFEKESFVKNFGMVGLSYGGFYTLFTTACDTRIKSAVSCSWFNDRDVIAWPDWTWQNSSYNFNDAQIAALCYPRRLCIQMGDKDELFDSKYTRRSFDELVNFAKQQKLSTDWLELIIFDGVHEFCKEDTPIERLVKDLTKEA